MRGDTNERDTEQLCGVCGISGNEHGDGVSLRGVADAGTRLYVRSDRRDDGMYDGSEHGGMADMVDRGETR